MDRPRIRVDFNEMVDDKTVLLSKSDVRFDSEGKTVTLQEGMPVFVYDEDWDDAGKEDNLIADGTVRLNTAGGWTSAAKWCCVIDKKGVRHEHGENI